MHLWSRRLVSEQRISPAVWLALYCRLGAAGAATMPAPFASSPVYLQWTDGAADTALRVLKGHEYRQRERPGGPLIFWEPRTLVIALETKGYDCHLQKWLNRKLNEPRTHSFVFGSAGAHGLDWRPSHRAGVASAQSAERSRWLRQEVVMSTQSVMAMLVWMAVTLYKQRRAIAASVLGQVMDEWLPSSVKTSFLSCGEFAGMCPARIGRDSCCCRHASRLEQLHLAGDDISPSSVCRLAWFEPPHPGLVSSRLVSLASSVGCARHSPKTRVIVWALRLLAWLWS